MDVKRTFREKRTMEELEGLSLLVSEEPSEEEELRRTRRAFVNDVRRTFRQRRKKEELKGLSLLTLEQHSTKK